MSRKEVALRVILLMLVKTFIFRSVLQLVRQLQGQDGEPVGEEVSATPKKIFQILHQVFFFSLFWTSRINLRIQYIKMNYFHERD